MRHALRLLVLLGVVAHGLLCWGYRGELARLGRGDLGGLSPEWAMLFLAPVTIGLGGALLARALHRRGSVLAVPAVALPIAALLLWYAVVIYITLNPLEF
jgi:hypothetical protein